MGDERVEGGRSPPGRGARGRRRSSARQAPAHAPPKGRRLGAAGEGRGRELEHLHRESCLAYPAGAGDRHESACARAYEGQQFGEFAVAADEWCRRCRRGVAGTAGRGCRDTVFGAIGIRSRDPELPTARLCCSHVGTGGSTRRAAPRAGTAAMRAARSSSPRASPSASARTVWGYGRRRSPRSRAPIAFAVRPVCSASSSCVSDRDSRRRRNTTAKSPGAASMIRCWLP